MQVLRSAVKKGKATLRAAFPFLVAGVGFEPHDLRVMSPTSYQAALPRDILVNGAYRARTCDTLLVGQVLSQLS